jgi:hypothetical protein
MFTRFNFAGITLAALMGAMAMSPGKAQAVVDANGIKLLCDTYEVTKTHYGAIARQLAGGDLKTIRWNIRKDEATGRFLYHYATPVTVTPTGHDRFGNVNSVSVLWSIVDDWKP